MSPLRRFAASPLRRFAASLLFFFLSSYALSAQCNNDNERFDIFATYTIQENINSEVEIVGGFEDRFYNSSHYRFNVTVNSAPLIATNFTINFGSGGQSQTINFTQADLPITRSFNVDYATITDTKLVTVTSNPSVAAAATLVQGFTPGRLTSRVQASSGYRTPTRTELVTGASFSPTCQGFLPTAKDRQSGSERIYMHTLLSPLNQTGHLRRPLIFLEGIDFDTKTRVCDPNVAGSDQTVHVGDFGWDNFITGVFEKPDDPDNETFGQLSTLTTQMLNEGYDLVFCDFVDGADWIQRNGLAVIAVIERVNADKRLGPPTGICFPNMVVGASMGGQVGKWALRTMENQGLNHDAALYVSFDSPQRGANIPLCVQSFIWFNATYGSEGDKASVAPRWNSLNRPAAQQLLVHHFNKIEQTNGCDLRQLFADEMATLGYPLRTRNIGTANGSGFGTGQGYSSSALLSKFKGFAAINPTFATTISVFDAELSASGSPLISNVRKVSSRGWKLRPPLSPEYVINYNRMAVTLQNQSAVQVSVFSQKETAIPFPAIGNEPEIPIRVQNLTFNHDIRNWDNAPGGNRRDIRGSLKTSIQKSLDGNVFIDFPINIADAANTQTFIPSISALDIQTGQDNVSFNISTGIGANPLSPNVGVTPFSAVFFPTNNEGHVKITTALGDFIIAQMNAAQVTLQSPLVEPYNYGLIRTIIPSVTIASGGILGINNNGKTAYVNRPTSEAPTTKAVFTATATSGCDANIVLQSGGQIQLGVGWSNAGVLRISNGSTVTMEGSSTLQANNASQMIIERGGTLQLQENSTLKLFNTAQIIVESGGRLVINGGANINLIGSESTIYVKSGGILVINGNMNFSGNGFFQFDAGHVLTLGADLVLRGSGKTTRMIRLNASPQTTFNRLTINGRAFNLSNALVEYGNNRCEINITNDNRQENAISDACFKGFGSGLALNFGNVSNANIQRCDFVNLTQGVNINSASNLLEIVRIESSNFNLVNYGITISSPSWLNIPKNREIFIGNCNFNYTVGAAVTSGIACRLKNMFYSSAFANNTFRGYREGNLFEDVTAIELQNSSLDLSGGIITNCKTGISAEKAANNNVQLVSLFGGTNPEISNCETGINLVGGSASSYSPQSYGRLSLNCARLMNNLTGVRGTDVRFTSVGDWNSIGANNTFQNPANGLLFDICYGLNATENIGASNNFWVGGFNAMRFRLRTGKGTNCTQGVARRIEQCRVLPTLPVNCNGNNGGWVPQNCCNRSVVSSNGAGSIITNVPIACLVGGTTTTKATTSAERTAIQSDVKLDEVSDDLVSIYPNPANQTVKIDIESGNYTLNVSNTVGQTIFAQNTEGSLSVDVSSWANGIYLFEITDKATNKRQRSKIVVQH